MYDLIIAGGSLVDGTGAAAVRADLAVAGNSIVEIGDLKAASAAKHVDATGRIVCPGFIDTHTHSEISVLANPDAGEIDEVHSDHARGRSDQSTRAPISAGVSP